MAFEKVFTPKKFLDATTNEWQKTSVIARKVGCSRNFAEKELMKLHYEYFLDMRKVKSIGRFGFTREWKKKTLDDIEKSAEI